MNFKRQFQLLLISLLIFTACEEEKAEYKPYQYIAYYGKSLRVCAEGTIEFTIEPDSTLTGAWTIEAKDGFTQNEIGPQVGSGKLSGYIKNDQFYVNLNPRWADNNVFFTAYFSEVISGGWYWSTFAGVSSSGGFTLNQ